VLCCLSDVQRSGFFSRFVFKLPPACDPTLYVVGSTQCFADTAQTMSRLKLDENHECHNILSARINPKKKLRLSPKNLRTVQVCDSLEYLRPECRTDVSGRVKHSCSSFACWEEPELQTPDLCSRWPNQICAQSVLQSRNSTGFIFPRW